MRYLLSLFLKFIGFFLNEKVSFLFKRIHVFIFSQIISVRFNKTGSVLSISPPLVMYGGKYISIGENFTCRERLRIEAIDSYLNNKYTPFIKIGDNVSFNNDCHLAAIKGITIGDNVVLASRIFISDHFHGDSSSEVLKISVANRDLYSKGEIYIGNNVWIGEGVVILPGVTIGDNCVIGANSVVNKSFEKNCIIGGVPARLLK